MQAKQEEVDIMYLEVLYSTNKLSFYKCCEEIGGVKSKIGDDFWACLKGKKWGFIY